MTRRWSSLQWVGLAVLVLFLFTCGPKPPDTPPEDMSNTETEVPEPPAREVTPPARPTPDQDPTPDPLSESLQEANTYAYENGLLGEVYFEFDKSDLDAKARDRLAKNASFLNEHGEFTLTIEGHCDDRGTNEYNIALGERRADAARNYLQSLGVGTDRVRIISYGEERGVCSDSQESCWWRNRRAYFLLSGRG